VRLKNMRGLLRAVVALAAASTAAGAEPKGPLGPAAATDLRSAYQRAIDFLPWQVPTWLTQHEAYAAKWSGDGSGFSYVISGPQGAVRVTGDARTGQVKPAAAPPADASEPPIAMDLAGRRGIGLEGFNLWLVDAKSGERVQLTTDGAEGNSYSALYEFGVLLESERKALQGPMRPAQGSWSPDGRYFASFRYDQRAVGSQLYWMAVTEEGYGARPRYVSQKGPYPGEPNAYAELVVCDTRERTVRAVKEARFETLLDPFTAGLVQWGDDGHSLHFIREGRGLRSATVARVDVRDGSVRDLYEEKSDTYLMLSGSRYPAIWKVLRGGARMLWFSELDGWGNLHLVDLATGGVLHPITRGAGVVTTLLRVDESGGWVYFVASGREAGLDPYFRQAYRARLDGSRVERLTPEPADHVISMPTQGKAFLDTQSAGVGSPPRVVLRSTDGKLIATIAQPQDSALEQRGWRAPERVKLRSADGRHEIYATVFRPSHFDRTARYPVLDYVYGLSSLARTPWSFPLGPGHEMADSYWHSHAIAELGFIVVKVDSPGTPLRGRDFARASYGAAHVGAMLTDHIAAMRQVAERDPSMDLGRVGIFGSSGGGFTSTRAMLLHPDFYKAAVSFAGSHDLLRLYGPEWGNRYIGPYEENRETYRLLSNSTFADRLAGKLLLVHGESDTEVTVTMTQQLVHALIAANEDFDVLYIPNAEHDLDSNAYAVRRRWDYFVKHLRGEEPPNGIRLPAGSN
jgi:dipeptidyl-peptidase-4